MKNSDHGHEGKPSTGTWRSVLKVHPAAELLPRPSAEALRELAADIRSHGLTFPIVLWSPACDSEEVFLLDGISRLDAMQVAGMPLVIDSQLALSVPTRLIIGDDPHVFAMSANLHRRHLTGEQRRELIGKLLATAPEKSDRTIGRLTGFDNKTVAAVRAEKEGREEIPHVSTRTDTQGRKQPWPRTLSKPKPDKPATFDEILEPWLRAPPGVRREFVNQVGRDDWASAIPSEWRSTPEISKTLEAIQPARPRPVHDDADLGIPGYLRRSPPEGTKH